jgi:hypothetical protein
MKALIVAALVVPMTAYVAGSLVSSSAGEPADRGPVIIRDPPSPAPAQPDETVDDQARVVTPVPTPVHDDVDDGAEGPAHDQANDKAGGRTSDEVDEDHTDGDDDAGDDWDDDEDDGDDD